MATKKGQVNNEQAKHREILHTALAKLTEIEGFQVRNIEWEVKTGNLRADARVDFAPPLEKKMWIVMKRTFTPAQMGPVLAQIKRLPAPHLLVAPYITPPLAERLREEEVQFLDCEGNAYLNQTDPKVLVWVTGNRPAKRLPGEKPLKVFRQAGLRTIFPLLCMPEATEKTYRDFAQAAAVALGTVANTFEELKYLGYLRQRKTGLTLENREELIDKWVDAYPRELRPILDKHHFETMDRRWWKIEKWNKLRLELNGDPRLGGGAAAQEMTGYLRALNATIFHTGQIALFAKVLKLKKAENGNVELIKKFWFFDHNYDEKMRWMVPPLLVYADLVATGNARNLETAEIIRERYLGRT